jgi:hypothetical protein
MRVRKQCNLARRQLRLEQHAWAHRQMLTPSEARLWSALRRSALGVLFRRQVPLAGRYIVDFCAPTVRLLCQTLGCSSSKRRDSSNDVLHQVHVVASRPQAAVLPAMLPIVVQSACVGRAYVQLRCTDSLRAHESHGIALQVATSSASAYQLRQIEQAHVPAAGIVENTHLELTHDLSIGPGMNIPIRKS